MKIDTNDLRTAFQVVDRVDTQPGLPSSQYVRIETKDGVQALSLTGLCVAQATCKAAEPGPDWTWYMDRRVFGAFLKTAKAKVVTVEQTKDALVWKAGRQKITAAGMSAVAGYAEWSSKGTTKLALTPERRKDLAMIAKSAPTTASADHLAAVTITKGYGSLASDSFAVAVVLDKREDGSVKLPVLLTQFLGTADVAEIRIDKDGAGIIYPNGYLYQPLPANAISSYPLKKISQVVTSQLPVTPLVKVKAKDFGGALELLKGYVFGSDVDVMVNCAPSKSPGLVLLSLDVMQGSAQTSMAAEITGDSKLSWPVAQLQPWVEFIVGIDPDKEILCGAKDGCISFSAKHGNRHYVLILAEKA